MDINLLEPEELNVELAIRQIPLDRSNLELLHTRVAAEEQFPLLVPRAPHSFAMRNPDLELKTCAAKLAQLSNLLTSGETFSSLLLRTMMSRLRHIRGRLIRLNYEKLIPEEIGPVLSKCDCLIAQVPLSHPPRSLDGTSLVGTPGIKTLSPGVPSQMVRSSTQRVLDFNSAVPPSDDTRVLPVVEVQNVNTRDEVKYDWSEFFSFPNIPVGSTPMKPPVQEVPQVTSILNQDIPDSNEFCGDLEDKPVKQPTKSSSIPAENGVTQADLCSVVHTFGAMLTDFRKSIAESLPPRQPEQNFAHGHNQPRASLPNPASISRILLNWNLTFSGSDEDVPVERFVSRVDQMAQCSGLNLNNILQNLTCILSGAAREWFWLTLERNPNSNWETIKAEMVRRFSRGITNREIRRMLDNRKQKYPREKYGEFQDAIMQIALQAVPPIPDPEVLDVLINNMRPGLQLALAGKHLYNIGQLAQEARSLETLWKQVRHNPESSITSLRPLINELNIQDNVESVPVELENSVYAINRADNSNRRPSTSLGPKPLSHCWNCQAPGHNYRLCRAPRTIFCFGCGRVNTYQPDCPNCQSPASGNSRSRENSHRGPLPPVRSAPFRILQPTDVATNTDPELYRRLRHPPTQD